MANLKKPVGRPPKPVGVKLEQRSIRLTRGQWLKVDTAGIAGLRDMINKWAVDVSFTT